MRYVSNISHSFPQRLLRPGCVNALAALEAECPGADHKRQADPAGRTDAGRGPVEPSLDAHNDRISDMARDVARISEMADVVLQDRVRVVGRARRDRVAAGSSRRGYGQRSSGDR
jgi:hypothetical protein